MFVVIVHGPTVPQDPRVDSNFAIDMDAPENSYIMRRYNVMPSSLDKYLFRYLPSNKFVFTTEESNRCSPPNMLPAGNIHICMYIYYIVNSAWGMYHSIVYTAIVQVVEREDWHQVGRGRTRKTV